MNKKTLMAAMVAVSAFASGYAYEGPTFELACWRGEETIVRVPDNLVGELDAAASEEGVRVERLWLHPVKSAAAVGSLNVIERYDRIGSSADGSGAGPALVKVSVSATAAPGWHSFGAVRVRVVDRTLPPPAEWKYLLDLWQHPWAIARTAGVKPFSPEHYAAMEPVYRALAWCGVKSLTTTLLELPWNHQCYDAYHSMIGRVRGADGKWTFDYRLFDEYVEFGRRCGLGPRIDCYTMCPWGYVVRWRDEAGEIRRAVAKPGTREFEDYWGDFLPDFARHLKAKGWFDDTFIAMDERSPEDVRLIAEFIRARVPDFKIQMAGNRNPADFQGITIHSYSQGVNHMTPEFIAETARRRAAGLVTTAYVCCEPLRPNTFLTSPEGEAFWLGVYPAFTGLDGFLRWAANSWPLDPCADAAFGNWAPGDTFLVYPGGELSLRLAELRAGIVAAEKLRLLADAGELAAERGKIAADFGDYRRAMNGQIDFRRARREIEALVNR